MRTEAPRMDQPSAKYRYSLPLHLPIREGLFKY